MILPKKHIPMILWFVLLAVAVPLLHIAMRVAPADPLPTRWVLPSVIGDWRGERVFFSADPEVTRPFLESEITQPGICPVSGATLDTVAPAERRLLPADITLERRLYRHADGRLRHVILLVTGSSREGIHRPEWCLAAQGVRTGPRFDCRVEPSGAVPFRVAVYPLLPAHAPADARASQYFIYWFEGGHIRTPYHAIRILKSGWDRLWSGKAQRWAYFSMQIHAPTAEAPDRAVREAVEWFVQRP